jgi:hypothetical protein
MSRWKQAQCPSVKAAPSPPKGAKSKNCEEGLLVCGLMRSTGWTDEVSTVQIADFSCWAADCVKQVAYLLGSADYPQMQPRAKQQAAEWDVVLLHVAVLRFDSAAADKTNEKPGDEEFSVVKFSYKENMFVPAQLKNKN